MKLTTINQKWDIWLPDHRADRPQWQTGWERKRLDSMFDTTRKGDVVYYVGAEEGDFAALLSMWGAKLVLFEPNEKVWPNIKAIWEANNLKKPLANYVAFASDVIEPREQFIPTGAWPTCASGDIIGDHGFRELRDPDTIPQITLDALPLIPQIISIDVEGSEGRVLRGAEQTLRKYHPRIYLSLHPEFLRTYDEWGAELRKWIIDLGYEETLLDYPFHEVHLLYSEKK